MGTDWYRMKPKVGTNLEELRALARAEAVAYQSVSGWYPVHDRDPVGDAIRLELHRATCAAATTSIRERVDLTEWDNIRACATDDPDLEPSWRVSVISQNPAFPPLVRCRAFRTILPDELADQLARWREWAEDIACGVHDAYLRSLHWYATADWALYHWSCLHGEAAASLAATGVWAGRSDLVRVREDILRLPCPVVPAIAISCDANTDARGGGLETAYPAALALARTLTDLTRQWDACVRDNKKLRYYESCYQFTLDEFRAHASGEWLGAFFVWVERCVERGFGLGLDC